MVSAHPGTYEIYSIMGSSALQFVSEHIGQFNEALSLRVGRYLILADCSHRVVSILSGVEEKLVAHSVEFTTPLPTEKKDLFSIQCSRYDKSQLKQQIQGRYRLSLIANSKDLLVGMLPFRLSLPEASVVEPQSETFSLGAFRVNAWQGREFKKTPYFVSPKEAILSITQPQTAGHWQFLLPGDYVAYMNGTQLGFSLRAGEVLEVNPAGVELTSPPEVGLEGFAKIRGYPYALSLNSNHEISLNTFYEVLPGEAKLKLEGASQSYPFLFTSGEKTRLKLRSILVDASCSPSEWSCLGRHEVSLYGTESFHAFVESVSDVPMLYFDKQEVELGLGGSKGIRIKIPPTTEKKRAFKIGKLTIIPKPVFRFGHSTELVRIETLSKNMKGHSHDIEAGVPLSLTLVAGTYTLARYTSALGEAERLVYKRTVVVKPGEETRASIHFFVGEEKLTKLNKKLQKKLAEYERKRRPPDGIKSGSRLRFY